MKFYENQVKQEKLFDVLNKLYEKCVNETNPKWDWGEWKYVVEEADGWLLHKAVCIDEVGQIHEKVFAQACNIPGYGWLYNLNEITKEDIIIEEDFDNDTEEKLICDECGKEFPASEMWEVEGLNLCEECHCDRATICDRCGEIILLDNAEVVDRYSEDGSLLYSEYLCKDCFNLEDGD